MLFKQLFDIESSTLTYLIADTDSREALLIDPVKTEIETYKTLLNEYGLTLKYSLETHVHADHITASGILRKELNCQTAVGQLCGAKSADIQIEDWTAFHLGDAETITARTTPGHTPGSVSFLWRDKVFTGDCLLINGCGRSDFQGGDAGALYDSITQKLFSLPDETLVYPGHDYKGYRVSSIGQEKLINPRLAGKTRDEFIELMNNLNLPKPKLIDIAVPANRYCGVDEEECIQASMPEAEASQVLPKINASQLVAQIKNNISEITVADTKQLLQQGDVCLIDVREPEEYEEGVIDGALKIPRGVLEFKISDEESANDPDTKIILFCRSGNRSALAAASLARMGYRNVMSMIGGYQAWKEA
jgi:sulfur dioxygenase